VRARQRHFGDIRQGDDFVDCKGPFEMDAHLRLRQCLEILDHFLTPLVVTVCLLVISLPSGVVANNRKNSYALVYELAECRP
jgi:hypothetical protein